MGGEWIPAAKGLTRKREVVVISSSTGRSRQEVVGCLIDLWDWADTETVDGRAPHVRLLDLAATIGVDEKFLLAVVTAGWLIVDETGITVPNFDRWLGNSAKKRLQKNRRQETWRNNVDAPASTKAPTREEKRIEEGEENPPRACDLPVPVPVPVPESDCHVESSPLCIAVLDDSPVAEPIPFSEFSGSAEDLAQRFADEYRGTYRQHKRAEDTRDGFAELIRLGVSPASIVEALHDKTRDRTEFFNDFKRRFLRPPGRAAPGNPTYAGLKAFAAKPEKKHHDAG